jgi:hypothetical protein
MRTIDATMAHGLSPDQSQSQNKHTGMVGGTCLAEYGTPSTSPFPSPVPVATMERSGMRAQTCICHGIPSSVRLDNHSRWYHVQSARVCHVKTARGTRPRSMGLTGDNVVRPAKPGYVSSLRPAPTSLSYSSPRLVCPLSRVYSMRQPPTALS